MIRTAAVHAALVFAALVVILAAVAYRYRKPRSVDADGNGLDDTLDARLAEVREANRQRWESRR